MSCDNTSCSHMGLQLVQRRETASLFGEHKASRSHAHCFLSSLSQSLEGCLTLYYRSSPFACQKYSRGSRPTCIGDLQSLHPSEDLNHLQTNSFSRRRHKQADAALSAQNSRSEICNAKNVARKFSEGQPGSLRAFVSCTGTRLCFAPCYSFLEKEQHIDELSWRTSCSVPVFLRSKREKRRERERRVLDWVGAYLRRDRHPEVSTIDTMASSTTIFKATYR